jgi:hypothetical protein
MLRDLAAWHVNGRSGDPSAALVALDRTAVLRAAFVRYRRSVLRPPEQQLRLVLDGDGVVLARAALRELGDAVAAPRVATVTSAPVTTPAVRPVVRPRPTTAARSQASLEVVAAWSRHLLGAAAAVAALLIAHTWWRDRWMPPGGGHGPHTD